MKLIFDIETDGLYDDVTRCWCICTRDIETGDGRIFFDVLPGQEGSRLLGLARCGSILDGLRHLGEARQLIGHNIIGYDLPVLRKIYGWQPRESTQITDTLVLSRLFEPDRSGGHSLAAWGERLSFPKGDHSDWSTLSVEMVHYCEQDTAVTLQLYKKLKADIKGQRWGESIQLEHQVAAIMSEQEINGVLFNTTLAKETIEQLANEVDSIDQQLKPLLPLSCDVAGTLVRPYIATGDLSARAARTRDRSVNEMEFVGPFFNVVYSTVDLNSVHQVKKWLGSIGWKPTEFTPTGGGKLTEDSFSSLEDSNLGTLLAKRVQCKHRIGQISGWLEVVRPDGRISAQANTIGTPTARMRHRQVVNVPSVGAFMGEEMRSMFCAPEGFDFVGHDASGLELRMLAHYMNDPEYTEVLLNGDIHSHNQELAGLHTRAAAKTFIYAFIYGAGDAKLGDIVEGGELEGAALRARFLRENPKLNQLITKAKRAARERGYLLGLDGRRIWLRRDERGRVLEHKALNTLLQCAGAVVMKKSMTFLDQWAKQEGLVYKKVIDMHDEGQAEVWCPHSSRYAELAVNSVVEAGKHFELNVPLAAEAKIGKNWAETH